MRMGERQRRIRSIRLRRPGCFVRDPWNVNVRAFDPGRDGDGFVEAVPVLEPLRHRAWIADGRENVLGAMVGEVRMKKALELSTWY